MLEKLSLDYITCELITKEDYCYTVFPYVAPLISSAILLNCVYVLLPSALKRIIKIVFPYVIVGSTLLLKYKYPQYIDFAIQWWILLLLFACVADTLLHKDKEE